MFEIPPQPAQPVAPPRSGAESIEKSPPPEEGLDKETKKGIDKELDQDAVEMRTQTPFKQEELLRQAQEGDRDAMERLLLQCDQLIHKAVKKIASRFEVTDTDTLEDLLQEARIGFLYAVDNYNPQKSLESNSTFLIYAYKSTFWYVYGRYLRTDSLIYIPPLVQNKVNHLKGGDEQKVDPDSADKVAAENAGVTRREQLTIYQRLMNCLSMRSPSELYRAASFPDEVVDPREIAMKALESLMLADLLGRLPTLTPREVRILKMRYGLGGERVYTLKEVAGQISRSGERVRQIEAGAIGKIRRYLKAEGLS